MQKRDYYEVLEIGRDTTGDEIKRAYRKVAIKFHPDRNPDDDSAEDKFKEATEAYAVLSDEEKRKRYDRHGHGAFESNGPGGFEPMDFGGVSDILEGLLGGMFSGRRRRTRVGEDIEHHLQVSFEEAALGSEKTITVLRHANCEACEGTGAAPGTRTDPCSTCRGQGEVQHQRGFFNTTRPCQTCRGTGHRVHSPCGKCKGAGRGEVEQEMMVRIPAGVENGAIRAIRGAGEQGVGGSGDLHVHVEVTEHPLFTREGADVLCTVPVSFPQAVLGTTLQIPTLEGPVKMKLPPGTPSGKSFRLRGKGIPVFGGYGKGDQLVKMVVEVPEKVNRKTKKLLEELSSEMGIESQPQQRSFLEKLKRVFE